ncbi:MAG: leucyl aminopeptidase [Frankiaceae bacterium]|jgi:leucyl aminopeptidase|nr:leucyl aminopeptidase [Frankiaceae bacterium]
MTSLSLAGPDVAAAKTDVLVVGAAKGPKGPVLAAGNAAVDKAFGGRLGRTLGDVGFVGNEDECVRLPAPGDLGASSVVVVGLGDAGNVTAETLRRAAGAGVRAAAGVRRAATTLALHTGVDAGAALRAVAEGALLGAYDFTRFRNASLTGRKGPVQSMVVATNDPKGRAATNAAKRAETVAAATALTRDLVNTPPGDLHPADLADVARTEATKAGCTVDVMDEKALRKGGYGGILGVGQGSANPPRLVRIGYTHPKAKRTIALVGKGVTFDSGGISIKPSASMEAMKSDMAGAASVVAALTAIARLGVKVNVTGWVPTAENMPSGAAIRPGDVLTMYKGKRVEVLNTDAEGRLILGDAITRAGEEKPDMIVDVATLTGAQIVALGMRTSGLMSNDDDLRSRIAAAAEVAGEQLWPMPLPGELRKSIDSDVADIVNTGDRYGGMLVAGVFLREFVPEGMPWAHLDIAGPAFNTNDAWGYTPKGGTGVPVRTFLQLAEDEAAR